MAPARTAVASMSALGRRSIQCLRIPLERQSRFQRRALLSTTSAATMSHSLVMDSVRIQRKNTPVSAVGSFLSRRTFSATLAASHGHWEPPPPGKELYVTFIDKDGNEDRLAVNEGDNLLTIAQANDIEMEGKFDAA
ncbi:2Fe-2S iron-sulfur cluster binding domain containing protein [Drepanopeziza brunnea f. sp. 'multigermtubi' MB_m1]|uniref:2Fe-2S iron-sulfur cluster binding domain containing protein n=1 Tax=Marssonina brunnea f. sp. multigermtubi (strain MB_m1) TaxID=1072389 RepID=K1WM22_MARBU|nr:2Fe-2S iron-sulfur cluster binding domain containing protein [Drepanopeziza brunnea f. sp. 'multigermtubi' MB_m1]EKD13382.1 2Fe-2S iron-sulfur cluster binding domain containing protein [Drepanopeziza brunnea f. sp. 'multigermtubi' MB_m1]